MKRNDSSRVLKHHHGACLIVYVRCRFTVVEVQFCVDPDLRLASQRLRMKADIRSSSSFWHICSKPCYQVLLWVGKFPVRPFRSRQLLQSVGCRSHTFCPNALWLLVRSPRRTRNLEVQVCSSFQKFGRGDIRVQFWSPRWKNVGQVVPIQFYASVMAANA